MQVWNFVADCDERIYIVWTSADESFGSKEWEVTEWERKLKCFVTRVVDIQ
jgi:hypothetical protein